jgi:hypothetical protein
MSCGREFIRRKARNESNLAAGVGLTENRVEPPRCRDAAIYDLSF